MNDLVDGKICQDLLNKRQYRKVVLKRVLINLAVSGIFGLVILLERCSDFIWTMSIFWGPVSDIAATMLLLHFSKDELLGCRWCSNHGLSTFPSKLLVYSIAFIPWFYTVWLRWKIEFPTALWMTPVSLVILLIYTVFCSTPNPVLTSSKGGPLSIQEMRVVHDDIKLAGLNPDRIGIATMDPNQVRKMSITDWTELGRDLELAGFKNIKS